MQKVLMITVLALIAVTLRADDAAEGIRTLIADALDWYSVWWSLDSSTLGPQICRGEFRRNSYTFRCDPVSVVVGVAVDDSGNCSIICMRPAISAEDGLRVLTLDHIVPPRNNRPAQPHDCGELPVKPGRFELAITPRARPVNYALTIAARDAALQDNARGEYNPCLLRFPNVKNGDPFFHVYEECKGSLESVGEFTIKNGKVADFPHWTYTLERGGFPDGAESRRGRTNLWFGVSR